MLFGYFKAETSAHLIVANFSLSQTVYFWKLSLSKGKSMALSIFRNFMFIYLKELNFRMF